MWNERTLSKKNFFLSGDLHRAVFSLLVKGYSNREEVTEYPRLYLWSNVTFTEDCQGAKKITDCQASILNWINMSFVSTQLLKYKISSWIYIMWGSLLTQPTDWGRSREKFSNIDFSLKMLPLKDDRLVTWTEILNFL